MITVLKTICDKNILYLPIYSGILPLNSIGSSAVNIPQKIPLTFSYVDMTLSSRVK